MSRRPRRRWPLLVLVAVLALVAASCQIQDHPPTDPGPLRYRDEIFSAVTTTSNVTYGSAVNEAGATQSLALDVYRPTGDTVTARPAIVWVHGGGFRGGNRTSPEIVDQAKVFAKKGFVTVSITYRLSATGCVPFGPQCISAITNAREDAQAAVRFLRSNATTYGIDTDRIAIGGSSAGAITAINVAYGSDQPGNSGNPGFPSTVRSAVSLSGSRTLAAPNAGEPSVLLFHGTADSLVPYSSATATIDAAHDAGLEAYLTTWEGGGHVPYAAHRTEILDKTTNFLYWSMNLANAAR
jgi:acetyl esterase/lipase